MRKLLSGFLPGLLCFAITGLLQIPTPRSRASFLPNEITATSFSVGNPAFSLSIQSICSAQSAPVTTMHGPTQDTSSLRREEILSVVNQVPVSNSEIT